MIPYYVGYVVYEKNTGNFAGLGHGIIDSDTNELIENAPMEHLKIKTEKNNNRIFLSIFAPLFKNILEF